VRFVLLLVVLAVLLLLPIHLNQDSALIVGVAGLGLLAVIAFTGVRQLLLRIGDKAVGELEVLGRAMPATTRDVRGFGAVLRALGVAVPALAFFLAWALVFIVIWSADPEACRVATTQCDGAFVGLGDHPLLGDFVYYAVNIAFANPPPDVIAQSRVARAAGTVEIVAGAGFLAVYLGAFLAGRVGAAPASTPPPTPPDPSK
jgi:hypothetical protein